MPEYVKPDAVLAPGADNNSSPATFEPGAHQGHLTTGKIQYMMQQMEMRENLHTQLLMFLGRHLDATKDIIKLKGTGSGKFRRTINFARKAYRLIGGSIHYARVDGKVLVRHAYEDAEGPYYAYEVTCHWTLPTGDVATGVGVASSRDPFLGREDDDDPEEGVSLPKEDHVRTNEAHIAQKALTEAYKQAVALGLGLAKDITEDEMEAYGINTQKTAGHNFAAAHGRQGGSKDADPAEKEARAALEVACQELRDIGFPDADGNVCQQAADVLKAVTANPTNNFAGFTTFRAIPSKLVGKVAKHVQGLLDKEIAAAENPNQANADDAQGDE